MNYRLKSSTTVPPDPGFAYTQPETGIRLDGKSVYETVQLVVKHRQSNDLPRKTEAECHEDVETQICQRLGPEWCSNISAQSWGFSNSWGHITAGTKTLWSWAKTSITGGNPYVEQSEADRRAEICMKCFARSESSGCLSCGFMNLVRGLIGETCSDKPTTLPESSNCLVCECLLKCKTHIRPEILKEGMSERQKSAYSEISNCWMNHLDN